MKDKDKDTDRLNKAKESLEETLQWGERKIQEQKDEELHELREDVLRVQHILNDKGISNYFEEHPSEALKRYFWNNAPKDRDGVELDVGDIISFSQKIPVMEDDTHYLPLMEDDFSIENRTLTGRITSFISNERVRVEILSGTADKTGWNTIDPRVEEVKKKHQKVKP